MNPLVVFGHSKMDDSVALGYYFGIGQLWDLTCLCLFHGYPSRRVSTVLGFNVALWRLLW